MDKIKKEMLLEMGNTCLSFNIKRAARVIVQQYDKALQPTGLRSTQLTLLAAIGFFEPIHINKIAETTAMERTTALRNCKTLEREGLISITSGADKRYKYIELTAKGWATIDETYAYWKDMNEKLSSLIGKDTVNTFLVLLKDIVKTMQQ